MYPSVKVKDAVAQGATKVKVGLKSLESCEEDGSAEQTTWAALAFNFSENGRRRYACCVAPPPPSAHPVCSALTPGTMVGLARACCRAEKKRLVDLAKAQAEEAKARADAERREQQRVDEMAKLLAVDLESADQVRRGRNSTMRPRPDGQTATDT